MKDNNSKINTKHWMSQNNRLYRIYNWIQNRCNNKNVVSYNNYWWRWIKCEWKNFEEFFHDMKEWYEEHLTIDRIDNNWNYCKENCRWATKKEQANNKRNNRIYEWKTISEWCDELWLKRRIIDWRLWRWWSVKRSLWLN